uniref:ORF-123 protein n=1 Tax=Lymantria dispar multicapsid nuclear polyhedrosis virus TaxID=10449 RepID=V9TJY2_NPVLD|nr:ORF-123 protein [Lymantria dispar multiple nucleopolyhedrovirus]
MAAQRMLYKVIGNKLCNSRHCIFLSISLAGNGPLLVNKIYNIKYHRPKRSLFNKIL